MYTLKDLKAEYNNENDDDKEKVLNFIKANADSIYECGILDDVPFFCKVLQDCEKEVETYGDEYHRCLNYSELIEEVGPIFYNLYMKKNEERAKELLFVVCKLLRACTYPSGFFDDMKDDFKHWEYLSVAYGIETFTYYYDGPVYNTALEEVTRQSIRRFDKGDMNQKLYIFRFWIRILEKYIDAIKDYLEETYWGGGADDAYSDISPENDNLSPYITAATLTMLPELFSKFNQCDTENLQVRTCLYSLSYLLKELGCYRLFPAINTSYLVHDMQVIYEKWEEEDNPRRSIDSMLYVLYKFYDVITDESKVPFTFIKKVIFDEATARKLKSGELVLSHMFVHYNGNCYSRFRFQVLKLIEENTFIQEVLTKNMSNSLWYLMFMKYADGNREGFEWHTCLTSEDSMLRGLCLHTIKPKELAQVPQFEEILVNSLKLAETECNVFLSLATLNKCIKMEKLSPIATQVLEHIFTHLESMSQQVEGYDKMLHKRWDTSKSIKLLKPGWYIFDMLSCGKMLSLSNHLISMIPNIPSDDFKRGLKDFVELLLSKRDEIELESFAKIMHKVLLEISDISPIEEFVPALVGVLKKGVKFKSLYTGPHSIVCLVLLSSMVVYKSDLYGTIFDTIIENLPFLTSLDYSHIRLYLASALVNANDEIKRVFYAWLISMANERRRFYEDRHFLSSNIELAFELMKERNDYDLFLANELGDDSNDGWELSRIKTIKQVYELEKYVVTRECNCKRNKDWEQLKPIKQALIECILRVLKKKGRKLILMKTQSVNGVSFKILNNGWQEMDRLSLDLAKWFDEMKHDQEFIDICERLPEELKPKLGELVF